MLDENTLKENHRLLTEFIVEADEVRRRQIAARQLISATELCSHLDISPQQLGDELQDRSLFCVNSPVTKTRKRGIRHFLPTRPIV